MFTVGQKLLYVGPQTSASYGETVNPQSFVWVVGIVGDNVKVKVGNGCTCIYGSFTTHKSNLRGKG